MEGKDISLAISIGDANKVRELIEQGIDVNIQDEYGWIPLYRACVNK